jgi:thiamine pyrophosphate-dependent acetolactate synthase large subunit-like protein
MIDKTGRFALIEQFLADGITCMFGNPGTVEEGFLDAVSSYPDFHYILTLHETVALAMADGYARATRKPAVVQLHSSVGLGNGIGMLYQAKRGHTPLVVINGEAGVRYDAMDGQMAADLVAMARPVTKWATRVVDAASLLRVVRRAIKMAATPPMGPVFVCLPMDILDAPIQEEVVATTFPSLRVAPEADQIALVASMLAGAQRPMLIMGDGIAASHAQSELVHVAERLGAQVWGADSSEVNMRTDHPLYKDLLGHMFGEHSRAIIAQADAILICGTSVFPEVFPALNNVFAPDARIIHIDLDANEIGKNFPITLGFISDPQITLAKLATSLDVIMTSEQKAAASQRCSQQAALKEQEATLRKRADQTRRNAIPLHASQFMEELANLLPEDAIIFDEALTNSADVLHYLPPIVAGQYFMTRGGSLGVGIPGALGIKLAHPAKTVLALCGDGASMYTIQALWTAAHHKIGAKFIICHNSSYTLLKLNIQQYWREQQIPEHEFPASFDIGTPDIRFVELAQAMGVRAMRVERAEQIIPALHMALADDEPFLIDLVLSSEIPEHIRHKVVQRYSHA